MSLECAIIHKQFQTYWWNELKFQKFPNVEFDLSKKLMERKLQLKVDIIDINKGIIQWYNYWCFKGQGKPQK